MSRVELMRRIMNYDYCLSWNDILKFAHDHFSYIFLNIFYCNYM
jgi:hypothetical protein